ncbi:uncharacterized protein Dwil_GK13954 [Drosophila willistoni]|uniref:Uncharacterized protein n=1 Tax=Drosophila willistoni TaxID=7260 RepID=B4NKN5_DROWI|nr:uncharacterized protein LOC6651466 [Drosophila willistoni]EDW84096.1 uncharacterized protein Dwil_GK13954 [Drosophila willistoni]
MENASIKRRSLTLSTRLLQKRHSASPQSRNRHGCAVQDVNTATTAKEASGSPSSTSFVADHVECTPPNKKTLSLDDSVDFSPRMDISMSPSCLFSQTMVTESPDVGWRWNRNNSTTDSGFDSNECSRLKDRSRQMSIKGCEDRRNQLDNEQWRAQQKRSRMLLKERCDKLHKQLEAPKQLPSEPLEPPVPPLQDPALAEFLNDSETDFFLMEASTQLESKLQSTQKTPPKPDKDKEKEKEKRSSFYMKFFEDEDESEDWLAAIDEAMLEASQPKKPRTSLQRYKSMPTTEVTAITTTSATTTIAPATLSTSDTPRMKRHASSHALSPATSSHARGKLFGSRK